MYCFAGDLRRIALEEEHTASADTSTRARSCVSRGWLLPKKSFPHYADSSESPKPKVVLGVVVPIGLSGVVKDRDFAPVRTLVTFMPRYAMARQC